MNVGIAKKGVVPRPVEFPSIVILQMKDSTELFVIAILYGSPSIAKMY